MDILADGVAEISNMVMDNYELDLLPAADYRAILEQIKQTVLSYEDLCQETFYMIPVCDTYVRDCIL